MKKAQTQIPFQQSSSHGAEFSEDGKHRYALWRIWDKNKPLVMFIGLNPSSANQLESDPTIKSVYRLSKTNGYGGFYMMNCFTFISTDPSELTDFSNNKLNDSWLLNIRSLCTAVVFAWGKFPVVKQLGRDVALLEMFPDAQAIEILPDGSPKHPLYCKSSTKFVSYIK